MKLEITDDELDKLNQLFKSNNIGLAIQLVKSLGYELEDVLYALYDKHSYFETTTRDFKWWVLNQDTYRGNAAICIRHCDDFKKPYCLWDGMSGSKSSDIDELTLEPCIRRLANILREHYDK